MRYNGGRGAFKIGVGVKRLISRNVRVGEGGGGGDKGRG